MRDEKFLLKQAVGEESCGQKVKGEEGRVSLGDGNRRKAQPKRPPELKGSQGGLKPLLPYPPIKKVPQDKRKADIEKKDGSEGEDKQRTDNPFQGLTRFGPSFLLKLGHPGFQDLFFTRETVVIALEGDLVIQNPIVFHL